MTKYDARQYIPLLEALADGELQMNSGSSKDPVWRDTESVNFSYKPEFYRRRPNPIMVKLGPEDVPPGTLVMASDDSRPLVMMIIATCSTGVLFFDACGCKCERSFEKLMGGYKISRDGGKTWQRCEKEVKQ